MEREIELLSRVTVNHLFLAQFEAFRASLLSLRKRKPQLALAILQTIVAQGGRINGVLWSGNCGSPSLLAWLSALELLKFDDASSIWNLDPEILRLKVEFILLVQVISSRVAESIRRLVDLESIEKEEVSIENFESRTEDFAEGANLRDFNGDLVDSVNFLDRISDLGLQRLKGDIGIGNDDMGPSDVVVSLEEGELQCLRKVIFDQAEIFDALCCNIQKQVHWYDPYDSGLAISVRTEEKVSLSSSEEELKPLTLIQMNVQMAHLDALRECLKEDDEDGAISHLRFLHDDYGVVEPEYR
ncbi:hypothetical protein HHK36_021580 [Tetracentron sinense]|uniref:Uncharacterized protein n=1 Tax=Tetracentron sinense TaxID=13715 RepID=A0A834YVC5_TETSI|nr:hypothetical protein HHK36_021580 [Tetracentron sinense]